MISTAQAEPTQPALPRIRTDEQRAADDAALLASGEPLATGSELCRMLPGLTTTLIGGYANAWRRRWPAPLIRYVCRTETSHARYCVADVRHAFEVDTPRREAARARRILEAERRNEAAHLDALARKAKQAKAASPAPAPAPAPVAPMALPIPAKRRAPAPLPEVVIMRRRVSS